MTWSFVHAADIHLDSPLKNLDLKEDPPIDLLRPATRQAFSRLVETCVEHQAAFLLLAGDLYDRDCPNMQVAVFLRNELLRLRDHGIPVFIIKGNHDAMNRITGGLSLPDNVRVLSDKRPETVKLDDLPCPVAIHGQSFRAGDVPENLAAGYPPPVPGRFNVGMLHTSLAGNTEHDEYAPCQLTDLVTRGYDYWALGHIHKHGVVHEAPWVVYPGNLQGRSVRETGPKGCYVVEVDGDRIVRARHQPLDVLRFQRVLVDLGGAVGESEAVDRIRRQVDVAWKACDGRPGAFRVVLAGSTPLHDHLLGRPRYWRETLLGLLGEVGRGEIWLETVRAETRRPVVERGLAAGGEPLDGLLDIVREIAADPAVLGPLLADLLAPLRSRLPEGLKDLPLFAELGDAAAARRFIERLEPSIADRLAGGTGD